MFDVSKFVNVIRTLGTESPPIKHSLSDLEIIFR